jgi:hypothetical protein
VQNRPDAKRTDSVLDQLSEGFFFGASHPVFNSNAVLDKSEARSRQELTFMVDDSEGRKIEFVQYMPGSIHSLKSGNLLPDTRVSDHMIHSGFIVHDRAAEDRFYKDILGFTVKWYGGRKEGETNWVDVRVPDGDDWLEYMLNVTNPSPNPRGQ